MRSSRSSDVHNKPEKRAFEAGLQRVVMTSHSDVHVQVNVYLNLPIFPYANKCMPYQLITLSQNTNNAREARLWRHNNDDGIKSDIGLKLAKSENQAENFHPQLYTFNSLSFVSPSFIFHPP